MRLFAQFLVLFFITAFLPERLAAGQNTDGDNDNAVVINEVLASNATTNADEDGDYEDWIELYNRGDQPVDLANFGLSDDYDEPFQWLFPEGTVIEPGEYLLVWASGKNRRNPGEPLHTNFRIAQAGEEVLLTHPFTGERLDEITPRLIPTDISFGRYPDGGDEWYFFYDPTPGAANDEPGLSELIETPELSVPSGFFEDEVEVSIHADDPDATILYTLDGSDPDPANLNGQGESFSVAYFFPGEDSEKQIVGKTNHTYIYDGPLTLSDRTDSGNTAADIITTYDKSRGRHLWHRPPEDLLKARVVRAAVYKNGQTGPTATATYIPEGPGKPQLNLPVLSITTGLDNLFGHENGIYVPGQIYFDEGGQENDFVSAGNYQQRGHDWERPVHIDFIDPGQGSFFSQNAGMRIHGGGSRNNDIKSFRLYARGQYDFENRFNYQFFSGAEDKAENKPLDTFNRLLMRTNGNLRDYLNDIAAHRLMEPTYAGSQRSKAMHHMINGEYWGLVYLRDRFDRFYIRYNYGVHEDNVVMIQGPYGENHPGRVEEGYPEDFVLYLDMYRHAVDNDLSDPDHYAGMTEKLDIMSYIDFNVVFIYLGNVDWYGSRHFRLWRARDTGEGPYEDGRWRYLVWDFDEAGLKRNLEYDLLYNAISPEGGGEPPYDFGGADRTALLRNLLENEEFSHLFLNRFADLMNTTFSKEHVRSVVQQEYDRIAYMIPLHEDRWAYPPTTRNSADDFIEYGNRRPEIQRQHIIDNFDLQDDYLLKLDASGDRHGSITVNTITVEPGVEGAGDELYPWHGHYFTGIPVTLEAEPEPGFEFSHWEGVDGSDAENRRITIDPEEDTSLKAVFTPDGEERFPDPCQLANKDCRFGYWSPDTSAAVYPDNMAFVYMEEENGGPQTPVTGFTEGGYNQQSGTRINGLGENGLAMVNAPSGDDEEMYPENRLGGVLFALDTRTDDNYELIWTGGTVQPGTGNYSWRLQYRIGDEGEFRDVTDENGNPVQYEAESEAGHELEQTVRLPDDMHERPYVQLLWRYGLSVDEAQPDTLEADKLRLDNIHFRSVTNGDRDDKPENVKLHQNYPNPFNDVTTIQFDIPEQQQVRIDVYDVTGRHVQTLLDRVMDPGNHTVYFRARELASGVLLYRLRTESYQQTRTMMLVQ